MPSNGTNSSGYEYSPEGYNLVFKQRLTRIDDLPNGGSRTNETWECTSGPPIRLSRIDYDDTTFKLHILKLAQGGGKGKPKRVFKTGPNGGKYYIGANGNKVYK